LTRFFFKKTVKAVHRLETVFISAAAATTTKAGLRPTPLRIPEFSYVFALYIFPSGIQDLFVALFFPFKCLT
jgi:hypothetical protein